MNAGEYVLSQRGQPWTWGSHDCCTFAAGWVLHRGFGDPMAFIRGKYDSERSALRRIKRGGGLVRLWSRGMADAGVPIADGLEVGDVGIIGVVTEDETREVCGIFMGGRWASLGLKGLVVGPAPVFASWRP